MVCRRVDIRVALVVTKQHIEAWFELFDQVVFEHERFGLGVDDRHFDSRHLRQHCLGLWRRVRAVKVGGDPLLEVARLADIDDLVLRIEHAIHAWTMRQAAQERLYLEG